MKYVNQVSELTKETQDCLSLHKSFLVSNQPSQRKQHGCRWLHQIVQELKRCLNNMHLCNWIAVSGLAVPSVAEWRHLRSDGTAAIAEELLCFSLQSGELYCGCNCVTPLHPEVNKSMGFRATWHPNEFL